MEIKVDYHFHPNLPHNNKLAEDKCIKWWNKIDQSNIKGILITEHVYKNPKRTYQLMSSSCPYGIFCFPGIEYITKEGIDMVVFSKSDTLYDIEKLTTPFALSYDELISLVAANDNLFGFITHPFTLGNTSVIKKLGEDSYFKYLNKIGAVEISNGSFINLLKIVNFFLLNLIFKNKVDWANRNFHLPEKYLPENIKFLAVGSDAHILEDVGCLGVLLEVDVLEKGSVFNSIINNKNRIFYYQENKFNILSLLKNTIIVFQEFSIKLRIKLCGK